MKRKTSLRKKLLYFLTVLFLNSLWHSTAFGEVTYIEKGEPSPFTGYLFTENKALEMRKTIIERDNYKTLSESLQTTVNIQSDISESNLKKMAALNQEVVSMSRGTDLTKFIWFGLGVATTGITLYAVKTLAK